MVSLSIPTAEAMEALGRDLAAATPPGTRIHLQGELGAGKTTLVRGFLRGLGHGGSVKSPTYTLVEPYALDAGEVFHFDLYRLAAPEELEAIGVRDYLDGRATCLIEWPERVAGVLPAPDLEIAIHLEGEGRRVELKAVSAAGRQCLAEVGP